MKADVKVTDTTTGMTHAFKAESAIVLSREDGFFIGNFKNFSSIKAMWEIDPKMEVEITLTEDWGT